MLGERLCQLIANIPTQTEAVTDSAQELTLGAHPLEKQHQLERKEDDRIDRGPATSA